MNGQLPLDQIPFTLPGSFLRISTRNVSQTHRVLLGTSSGAAISRMGDSVSAADLYELALFSAEGEELAYSVEADYIEMRIFTGNAEFTLIWQDGETLRFSGRGAELRWLPCQHQATCVSLGPGQLQMLSYPARAYLHFRVEPGTALSHHRASTVNGVEKRYHDYAIQVTTSSADRVSGALRVTAFMAPWSGDLPTIADLQGERADANRAWLALCPAVPTRYQETAIDAWFMLRACEVPGEGFLARRRALYMSKFWMNRVWSWDNCFNALVLLKADADLAWDQVKLFFDHQAPNGQIADCVNNSEIAFGFTKPPLYGWVIRKMALAQGLDQALPHIRELYEPVRRLTEWWFTARDLDGDGLCEYHHGNDSGWDNGTIFDHGFPTAGVDLTGWLILQCESLAWMAELLGKPTVETEHWNAHAERLRKLLISRQIDSSRRPCSPLNGAGMPEPSRCLLNYFTILLGARLPEDIWKNLVDDLRPNGAFLTEFGLASESPRSPKYEANGYWRGPIWAVSTYLVAEGLYENGEIQLAREIARRFCELCVRVPGFWENYDALTGQGLRCPAYSWTAACFVLLAQMLPPEG